MSLKAFTCFRRDREGKTRGVSIFIQRNIAARKVTYQTSLETVGAEIKEAWSLLRCVATYNSPKKELLMEDVQELTRPPNTIIAGDLNGLGCRFNNKTGRLIASCLDSTNGLEVHAPEDVTTIPQRAGARGDILDIFLTYQTSKPWDVQTHCSLSSDHFPVTVKIGIASTFANRKFRRSKAL